MLLKYLVALASNRVFELTGGGELSTNLFRPDDSVGKVATCLGAPKGGLLRLWPLLVSERGWVFRREGVLCVKERAKKHVRIHGC